MWISKWVYYNFGMNKTCLNYKKIHFILFNIEKEIGHAELQLCVWVLPSSGNNRNKEGLLYLGLY